MSGPLPPPLLALQERLRRADLPGQAAHRLLKPAPLDGREVTWPQPDENHQQAAVLMLLYPRDPDGQGSELPGNLHLILMRRPDYDGVHAGQISLPGGRRETVDTSLAQTALREAHEEVGVAPETVRLLGALSPFFVFVSNHNVHPYVGYAARRPDFVPCPEEVAGLVEVPLAQLLDPAHRREEVRDLRRWGASRVPYFDLAGERVWGATAMMLSELVALLEEVRG